MKRVTGIGGISFKAKDAPALQAWYKRHLGIDVQEWGGAAFTWTDGEGKPVAGTTAWSIGSAQSDQFAPGTATFMVNYRVEDLHALVKVLREEGCNVLERVDDSEYGKFAWVIDPEGNKVELWQPLPAIDLAFTPGMHLGPFWKHFRHLGRVQENYLQAIDGEMARSQACDRQSHRSAMSGRSNPQCRARHDSKQRTHSNTTSWRYR